MSMDELVSVLVPRRYLAQVYGLIAKLDSEPPSVLDSSSEEQAGPDGTDGKTDDLDEWTLSRLRRMVDESPPAMLDILQALADRSGEWLTMADLAHAIRHKPDADWNTVAGTLGAFGRRVKNRYGLESWPFESRFDHKVGGRVSRMNQDIARIIKRLIAGH